MSVIDLKFQGINRTATDYASAGACEELINLRPTGTGLIPVKPFVKKIKNNPYAKIFVHESGTSTNYIAIKKDSYNVVHIFRISESGVKIGGDMDSFSVVSLPNFSYEMIHFAYTGNIVLFSIADHRDKFYSNISFLWDGTSYIKRKEDIPAITYYLDDSIVEKKVTYGENYWEAAAYTSQSMSGIAIEAISTNLNAIQENNKEYCFGAIIVAFAFHTKDGKTFWTNQWFIYDPTKKTTFGTEDYFIDDPEYFGSAYAANFEQFFTDYPEGGYMVGTGGENPNANSYTQLYGVKLALTINSISSAYVGDGSTIDSLEIYASRPSLIFDPAILYGITREGKPDGTALSNSYTLLPHLPYDKMGLDNQLLYLQKSIPLSSLAEGAQTINLEFGGNLQVTNKTLDVDAGAVTRFGEILAFNSRFHFFDSVSKTELRMPEFTAKFPYTYSTYWVFIRYNDGEKDSVYYLGEESLPDPQFMNTVISPSLNVKEVIMYNDSATSGTDNLFIFSMSGSSKYNYAIWVNGYGLTSSEITWSGSDYQAAYNKGVAQFHLLQEPAAINVTEQFNTIVFRVDHSYLAPGKVLDIQPQMVAVKDVTYGDYPLNVFTNRGLYALLQGSGTVLYGAFRSISNLITTSNSVPTEMGTFFIAAGGLWLIAGNTVVLVSDALRLGPHKYIRNCFEYVSLCCSVIYSVAKLQSQVPFDEYVSGAELSYNRYRDEIFVSNPRHNYTYVLSLRLKQWFKVDYTISQNVVGSNLAFVAPFSGRVGIAEMASSWLMSGSERVLQFRLSLEPNYELYGFSFSFTRGDETLTEFLERVKQAFPLRLLDTDFMHIGFFDYEIYTRDSTQYVKFIVEVHRYWSNGTSMIEAYIDNFCGYVSVGVNDPETGFDPLNTEMLDVGNGDMADMSLEDDSVSNVTLHFQTRPFSIGYQYTHIHRIISMVRAHLSSSDVLVLSLYGSDDLQNWKLLSYADRSNVTISQIRTPSAARSWRYYTICFGGKSPLDIDYGDTLVDYQPVVRRIG